MLPRSGSCLESTVVSISKVHQLLQWVPSLDRLDESQHCLLGKSRENSEKRWMYKIEIIQQVTKLNYIYFLPIITTEWELIPLNGLMTCKRCLRINDTNSCPLTVPCKVCKQRKPDILIAAILDHLSALTAFLVISALCPLKLYPYSLTRRLSWLI